MQRAAEKVNCDCKTFDLAKFHAQGWTYGLNEDVERRRSPHLVHYTNVDEAIKVANRNTASETVRTLLVYGYVLDPPSGDKVGRGGAISTEQK